MRLLIDLGNTRIKWRWWTPQGLSAGGESAHAAGHLRSLLKHELHTRQPRLAHISCVARPALREELGQLLDQSGIAANWLRSPANGLGLTNSYAQPEKWGVDRWLALAAAYAEKRAACGVIDVGTAMTVDLCNDQGQHQGGLIAPGPLALSQALDRHTALPMARDELPATLGWARDTEEALQFGALHAACGLIERTGRRLRQEFPDAPLILTGGGAPALARYLEIPCEIDPDLVFKGLALHAQSYAQTN